MTTISTAPAGDLPTPAHESMRIVVFAPTTPPRAITIQGSSCDVGRSSTNAICLDDARVSGRHARLRRRRDTREWWIEDAESRNGTLHNGVPIQTARLENGSVLRLGDSLLVVEFTPTAPPGTEPTSEPVYAIPSWFSQALEQRLPDLSSAMGPWLVHGPSGAGKGYLVRRLAAHANVRLTTVNCAALSPAAIESELFGHAAGAFPGATQAHIGLVQAAQGGILFLDEVDELAPALQAKLLTAVEDRRVRPVGATMDVAVRVRIAAAVRDPSTRLRPDLYERLAHVEVAMPPLRARPLDVYAILVDATGLRWEAGDISAEALEALLTYAWPGNAREVQRVCATVDTPRLDLEQLPPSVAAIVVDRAQAKAGRPRTAPSREVLTELLAQHGGNASAVARELGVGRTQLRRWLDAYALR